MYSYNYILVKKGRFKFKNSNLHTIISIKSLYIGCKSDVFI